MPSDCDEDPEAQTLSLSLFYFASFSRTTGDRVRRGDMAQRSL